MAKITRIGQLGSTGVSSGPHLHGYVKNLTTGEYEDPRHHPEKFLNVRIGPNRVPKYIRDKAGTLVLNPAAGLTITSEFGPRNTDIPRASTYHRGRDYAGKEGTEVYVEGDIKFTPRPNAGGYGNLATWNTADNKYELGYGHMKSLGEATDLTNTSAVVPQAVNYEQAKERTNDLIEAFVLGTKYEPRKKEERTKPQTLLGSFKEQLLGSVLQNAFNPFGAAGLTTGYESSETV